MWKCGNVYFPMKVLHFLSASAFVHFPWPPVQSFSVQKKFRFFHSIFRLNKTTFFLFSAIYGTFHLFIFLSCFKNISKINHTHTWNKSPKPPPMIFKFISVASSFVLTLIWHATPSIWCMIRFCWKSNKHKHEQSKTRGNLEIINTKFMLLAGCDRHFYFIFMFFYIKRSFKLYSAK